MRYRPNDDGMESIGLVASKVLVMIGPGFLRFLGWLRCLRYPRSPILSYPLVFFGAPRILPPARCSRVVWALSIDEIVPFCFSASLIPSFGSSSVVSHYMSDYFALLGLYFVLIV